MSIFELINNYETHIIISISLTLGLLEAGSSSWVLKHVNSLEKYLHILVGYHYSQELKESLHGENKIYFNRANYILQDVKELKEIEMLKICVSLCLIGGVAQILSSILVLATNRGKTVQIIWLCTNVISFLVISTSFGISVHYGWKDSIHFQVLYAVAGVNCLLTAHLVAVIAWELLITRKAESESEDHEQKSSATSMTGTEVISIGAPSTITQVPLPQEEANTPVTVAAGTGAADNDLPLPPPPPPHNPTP